MPKKLFDEINEKTIKNLVKTGRIEFINYADDPKYFAILDKKHLYNHGLEGYNLLKENFKSSN